MNPTESPNLDVRGPADLLAAVPYLLGFHPSESLVVIGLADTTITVTARINLPDLHLPTVAATLLTAVNWSVTPSSRPGDVPDHGHIQGTRNRTPSEMRWIGAMWIGM